MLDLGEDVSVVLATERWPTAEEDVEDDSAAPNIAFFVVLFAQDFGGDVVSGAVLLCQLLALVVDGAGAEVDYFDCRVCTFFVEQKVFGL